MTTSDRSSTWSPTRRASLAIVVAALLGLTSSFGGTGGTVQASDSCTAASPGASDYCSSSKCGPCAEGEGDCDPGQCGPGLACVEEGATDHCRAVVAGSCTAASPGAGDYCSSSKCGPCEEGEGDCDPGQCGPGLECVEEGATDHCRPVWDGACTAASPGASDYCSSSKCGPCLEGEGDCDPGQCGPGLTCMEEGAVDRCRAVVEGTCTAASPGSSSYCAADKCGPCLEGEGDCDPGQCGTGLECVEEGSVDHCRPIERPCADAAPGAMDYCSADKCGVCAEGEGDCEPGQCGGGLTCVEEGAVDRCRPVGERLFQVQRNGAWTNVCCVDGQPRVSDVPCGWTEAERVLTDRLAGRELDCPESGSEACVCDGSGEKLHGVHGGPVTASLDATGGGPLYPDYRQQTCLAIDAAGNLVTQTTSASCPLFRLE